MGVYNRNTFGEQIAFSRADMATRVKDFDLLCDMDKQALARKDKLWKLPTAAKAVQESGDQGLCYWRKLIRDCVYPYPRIYHYERKTPAFRHGDISDREGNSYAERR